MSTPLGYSPSGNTAVCDLDANAVAVGNAAGNAAAAVATANTASATASTALTAANTASGQALGAQATANYGVTVANAAQVTANAALAAASGGLNEDDSYFVFNPKAAAYGAVGNGVADDTVALQACADACNAAGGGIFHIPRGTFLISADISVTRLCNVLGAGAGAAIIRSASPVNFKIVGAAANGAHVVSDVSFDGVTLAYGVSPGDQGRACVAQRVEVQNCAGNGIYYGYNCYLNDLDNCFIHDCGNGVYYDLATAVANAGASQTLRACKITNNVNAIVVNGNTADGHHITAIGCDLEHCTNASFKSIASGEGMVMLRDCHFELIDGYFIDNAGCNVWVDGLLGASVIELAWVKQSSGNVFLRTGRGSWTANKFALITGGTIVVEPDFLFCAARWFSEGVVMVPSGGSTPGYGNAVPMVVAGSNGGKIVLGGPTVYRSQTNAALTTVTNASKGPVTMSLWYARDGNTRSWEFWLEVSAVGTDNLARFDLTNGSTTVRMDVALPVFVGGGRFKITNVVGVGGGNGLFNISGIYVETVSGKATRIHQSTADWSGALGANRSLTLTTEKLGATASTMTIDQMDEYVSGPTFVGL